MTNIDKIKYQDVGNIYGERTWVEYGFRQITKYTDIALLVGNDLLCLLIS